MLAATTNSEACRKATRGIPFFHEESTARFIVVPTAPLHATCMASSSRGHRTELERRGLHFFVDVESLTITTQAAAGPQPLLTEYAILATSMETAPHNPASNQIGAGLNEAQVLGAVEKSGYPLQTIVGDILRSTFDVQHEWCYVDKDTNELRTIDIHARRRLHEWDPQPRVRPQVDLLLECKQSQLPYVFFLAGTTLGWFDHPEVAGLHNDTIEITTDDDLSTFTFRVIGALDLNHDSFQREPPYCNYFSKCVRKGSEIELSGTEAYSGLILPLIKGLQHLRIAEQPRQTAWYFDAHLVLALGVLDAPMIAASVENDKTVLTLVPWVRVLRHEYLEEADKWERDRLWAVDIVHKDFFAEYVDNRMLPFAQKFSERVLRHPTELATGKGFVPGMGKDSWGSIENGLKARPMDAAVKRPTLILKNLLRLFSRHERKS